MADEGVGEDDFSQFDRDVVFVRGAILIHRRTDRYWRYGKVLPDVLFGAVVFGPQANELAIL